MQISVFWTISGIIVILWEINGRLNVPTLDEKREEEKLNKTREQIQKPAYKESGVCLMEKFMELSKKLQNDNR